MENRRNKLFKLLKNYKIHIFPNDLYHVYGRIIAAGCHANEFFLITLPHMEHISHPCCARCIQYSDFCPLKCLVNEYDWCKWPSNRPHLLKVTTSLSTNIQKIQCQQIICTNFKKSKALYISKDVFRKFDFQKLEFLYGLNFDLIKDGGFVAVTEEMNFPNSSDVEICTCGMVHLFEITPTSWNRLKFKVFSSAGNWSSNFRFGFSRLHIVVINTYKYPATPWLISYDCFASIYCILYALQFFVLAVYILQLNSTYCNQLNSKESCLRNHYKLTRSNSHNWKMH